MDTAIRVKPLVTGQSGEQEKCPLKGDVRLMESYKIFLIFAVYRCITYDPGTFNRT